MLLLITLLFITSANSKPSFIIHEGDACEAQIGVPGTCKDIRQCPENKCNRRVGVPYKRCTFVDYQEVVCCSHDRPSVRACNHYRQEFDRQFFIFNGTKAKTNEFPHMAVLGYRSKSDSNELLWYCGGSLISDRFVLTAAHCTQGEWGPPVKVRLGRVNINEAPLEEDAKFPTEFDIGEIILHKYYKRIKKYNDIALLRLSPIIMFSKSVYPACLFSGPKLMHNLELTATGWGAIDRKGVKKSNDLLKTKMIEWNWDDCVRNAPEGTELSRGLENSTMLCAQSTPELGNGDTCSGDSGGPIQFKEYKESELYSIVGVTSFGLSFNCGVGMPGIYTKVYAYLEWIECNVWRGFFPDALVWDPFEKK